MILRSESQPPNSLEILTFILLLINLTILSYAVFAPPPFSTEAVSEIKTTLTALEEEIKVLKTNEVVQLKNN